MPIPEEKYKRKNPGTARFLTLIVPGLGHLYARQFLGGCIALLLVAPFHLLASVIYFYLFFYVHFFSFLSIIFYIVTGSLWASVLFWFQKDAAERCVNYNMSINFKEEKERKDAFRKNNPFGEKSLKP